MASSEQSVVPAIFAVSPGGSWVRDLAHLLVVVGARHPEDERRVAAGVRIDRARRHLHVERTVGETVGQGVPSGFVDDVVGAARRGAVSGRPTNRSRA